MPGPATVCRVRSCRPPPAPVGGADAGERMCLVGHAVHSGRGSAASGKMGRLVATHAGYSPFHGEAYVLRDTDYFAADHAMRLCGRTPF